MAVTAAQALCRHERLILWWAARFARSLRDDAEDLAQIARIAFCAAWDQSDPSAPEKMRVGYATTAIKHALINLKDRERRPKRHASFTSIHATDRLELDHLLQTPAFEPREDLAAIVQQALAALTPADRKILQRIDIDGTPQAAIAEEEGVTRQAISERIRTARARLRAQLPPQLIAELSS